MGLFEELEVPTRFDRLRKYFDGLQMSDLHPDIPYETLVEPSDKLMMLVFCRLYIRTYDHRKIRAMYRHLDKMEPLDLDYE